MTFKTKLIAAVCLLSTYFCCAQDTSISWEVLDVKDPQKSAGFIDTKDLDGDGFQEILLSTLQEYGGGLFSPKGALRLFDNRKHDTSTRWTEKTLISIFDNLGFINAPVFMDIDQDGIDDILVHQGFLATDSGSYFWLKGPDFKERNYISEETSESEYFWHETVQIDMDSDGLLDLVSTSANTNVTPAVKRIEWYHNQGDGSFEQHIISESFGGVFIKSYDIDNDNDQDLVVSQFFGPPAEDSIVWLEQQEKPSASNNWVGVWEPHTIDNTTGLGYHIEFYDIDADGKEELVYNNHNNLNNDAIVDTNGNPIVSGIYSFEIPQNPRSADSWEKNIIDEGFEVTNFDFGNPASQGSTGIFSIGDIDNNGYPDIVLPGDGAEDLFFLQQNENKTFTRSTIATGTMFGQAKITDIDGDGSLEVLAAMHNMADNFFQAIFNFPDGHLKIYKPIIEDTEDKLVSIENSLAIYPNPANNEITISLKNELSKNRYIAIRIMDSFQVEKYRSDTDTDFQTINISQWNSGFYFVEFNTGEQTVVKKFFKE